jgi:hypothetical protein
MASNKLDTSLETRDKHPLSVEGEIQISTSPTKTSDPENVEFGKEVIATDPPKSSDGTPGENVEVRQGTTNATKTEPEYPRGIRFVILTISLMLGVYMEALDTTIICESQEFFQSQSTPS